MLSWAPASRCCGVLHACQEPGRPLFVSLILYLNDEWPSEWDAETLFLDTSDTGIVVRPKVRVRARTPWF